MMQTTYNCNSIISIRAYSAFNNYSLERFPSNYCSCCCLIPINSCKLLISTNPSYCLYGLRQSTLIQWPPSRRLILGSGDRHVSRYSNCNMGKCCCSESCCVKQDRIDRIIRRSCVENCCVSKVKSVDVNRIKGRISRPKRDLRSNALGDAEAMLSLLTEGNVEECVLVREKKRSSFQEGDVVSKQSSVIGKLKDRKPNLDSGYRDHEPKNHRLESCRVSSREEGPKREDDRGNLSNDENRRSRRREPRSTGNVVTEKFKESTQNVDSGCKESESLNHGSESYRVPSREEGRKREEDRENHSKDEDLRSRRRESSSSYYSFSDSGDFESDTEVKLKQEKFVVEPSVSHKKDLRKSGGIVISERTEKEREKCIGEKEWEKCGDEKEQVLPSGAHKDLRVGGSIQRDWRKKSEKKLTEEYEEIKSRNDSVARQSQLSQAQENSSMIESSLKKQFNFQDEQLTSDAKSFGQSSFHAVKDNRASAYSKFSSQREHSIQKSREDTETTATTWRRSSQGKDSSKFQVTGCDYCETCGRSVEEKKTQSDIQRHTDRSEKSIDAELTLSGEHLSESNQHRKHERSSSSLQGSAHEESRQYDRTHMVSRQASAKRKPQKYRESISADDSTQSKLHATEQSEVGSCRMVKSRTTAASESRSMREREGKSSSSLQISAKEEKKEHDEIILAAGKVDARRISQSYGEIMNSNASYPQSTLRSQQQAETQKKQVKKTTSHIATEEAKRLLEVSSSKLIKDIESSKVSHTDIGESRVHSSNLEINSQSAIDKQVSNEQTSSKLKLKSLEEIIEKRKWIDETIVQSTHRTEVQGPSTGRFAEETTINHPSALSISQTGVQQFIGEEVTSGHLLVASPPYQHVSRLSQFPEASNSPVRKDMGRTTKVGSDNTPEHAQSSSPASYDEVDVNRGKFSYSPEDVLISAARMQDSSSLIVGEFVEKMSHETSTSETSTEKKSSNLDLEHQDKNNVLKRSTQLDPQDALVSAARMQESSSLILGEFDEKMSQEASNSETNIEKELSIVNSKHQDKNNILRGSMQSDSDKTGSQKHGSDHSFVVSSPDLGKTKSYKLDSTHPEDSGTEEPSDQMWDVKDHFIQESPEIEPLEDAASESIVAVRTGRSLWHTVTGALRLRWGSHSEDQRSPVKRQSSPSENQKSPVKRQSSPSSGETWFSENEADEANGIGMKSEGMSLLQDTSSNQSLLETTRSRKEDIVVTNLNGQSSHINVSASYSSSHLQSSSPSGVAFLGQNINMNIAQHLSQPSTLVDSSTPSRHLRRSFAFEGDDEAEKIEAPTSSSDEQRDSSADVRQMDDSASVRTDVELKRRKLQRSKAVLQRYDEWEDAYRREREQRKVDEIFMREALSEAIKAADSWEVPVGAVLVQNGKIIARGYNLVEELRDSTAHAEMLCIREASNVLRTWRLSETTLYVTLEPCPMCAGAILQARISTLVWGAPNKLLGADGSWIRLFPAGVEGESSELTDKPAAPVHPFHPNMTIRRGILEDECADLMQQFFQLRRRKAKVKVETSSEESVQPSCFPRPQHRPRLLHKMHNVFHPSKQRAD
ncbi:tRNA(adenine(34)) deaminase chloroplastic [Bienertia sinuspersici]